MDENEAEESDNNSRISPFTHIRFPFFTSSPWNQVVPDGQCSYLHHGLIRINLQGVILNDESLRNFLEILKNPVRLSALNLRGCLGKGTNTFDLMNSLDPCHDILDDLVEGVSNLACLNYSLCHLATLNMGVTRFSHVASERLGTLLSSANLRVSHLGLQQCTFEPGDLSCLLEKISVSLIQVLDISKNTLDLGCFQALNILMTSPECSLNSLDCSNIETPKATSQQCWVLFGEALSSHKCHLKFLYLDGVINTRFHNSRLLKGISENISLKFLTLDQNVFNEEALRILGNMIRKCHAPAHLSLRNCQIGPQQFGIIEYSTTAGTSQRPSNSCFLDLGWNTKLDMNSLLHLLAFLRSTGRHPTILHGIGLQGIPLSSSQIPTMLSPEQIPLSVLKPSSFANLVSLDISRTGVGIEYITQMTTALTASWLEGSRSLPHIFSPPLRDLNLNNNPLGAAGAEAIAAALSELYAHPLRSLCISGCHIGQRGSLAIVNWLKDDGCLNYLELHPQDRYPGFPLQTKETLFHEPLHHRQKLAFLSVLHTWGLKRQEESCSGVFSDTYLLPVEAISTIFAFCECPITRTIQFLVDN